MIAHLILSICMKLQSVKMQDLAVVPTIPVRARVPTKVAQFPLGYSPPLERQAGNL